MQLHPQSYTGRHRQALHPVRRGSIANLAQTIGIGRLYIDSGGFVVVVTVWLAGGGSTDTNEYQVLTTIR